MLGKFQLSRQPSEGLNQQPSPLFYIVSPDTLQANLLKSYLDDSFSTMSRYYTTLPLQAVCDETTDHRRVYLLDCLEAEAGTIEGYLELGLRRVPDHIMVVLYNIVSDRKLVLLVKRYKIRGIFYRENSRAILIKGMNIILNGNLWLSRKMLTACVFNSGEKLTESSAQALNLLSRKENEALSHILAGESNQEIADAMGISLHTVKTHLYNAYKKIKVPNRLQAALWAAANLQDNYSN